ncbi:hypothetical protein IAT40_005103 [Kwoniella sp. CBS 6097]
MPSSGSAHSPSAFSGSSDNLSFSAGTFGHSLNPGDYDHCCQLLLEEWGIEAFYGKTSETDVDLTAAGESLSNRVSEEDPEILDTIWEYIKAVSGETNSAPPSQRDGSRKGVSKTADIPRLSQIVQLLTLRLSVICDAPLDEQSNILKKLGKSTNHLKGSDWELERTFLSLIVAIHNGTFDEGMDSESGIQYQRLRQHEDNPHCRARLDVLKALRSIKTGVLEALSTIEEVITHLDEGGYHTYTGLLNHRTAVEIRSQTRSTKLAAGFSRAAFDAYTEAGLRGVSQHLAQRQSDGRGDGQADGTSPLQRRMSVIGLGESPRSERSQRSLSTGGEALQSSRQQPENHGHGWQQQNGEDHLPRSRSDKDSKGGLDPLVFFRESVSLANQDDPSILRVQLLEVLCQSIRAEYAALALYESTEEKKGLRLKTAGTCGHIESQDLILDGDGEHSKAVVKAVCPVTYMKYVADTAKAITKRSGLSKIGPDKFYGHHAPAAFACVPVVAEGRSLGILLLSSSKEFEHSLNPKELETINSLTALGVLFAERIDSTLSMRRDIEQQTRDLQDTLRAKTQFLSQCSHELRSPLSAVLGLSAVLDASPGLSGVQREHIQIIRSSANDLLGLINNILDHSRLESDSVVLERIQFSLRDVVETALDTIAPSAQAKNVEVCLTNAFDEDPPDLIGDPFRVKQIVLNLLSNAVKFTPKGRVSIEWRFKVTDDKVKIDLAVNDTGIGIPASKMNKLFKSFSQVDSSITRNHGGSGLGLIISKDLAKLLGGDCYAESEIDKGSTFHFSFVADVSAIKDTKWDHFSQPKSCFIICDPDPWWKMLDRNLTAMGCRPLRFEEDVNKCLVKNHDNGLDSSKRFDFVIIDTRCITPHILAKMKQLQPNAKFIYLAKITALGEAMKDFDLSRDEIVARPIKFASLYKALMDPSLSHDGTRGAKPPNQAKKLVDKGLSKAYPLEILLVDDNAVNVSVGKRLLELFGYTTVDSASGGQRAIEMAQEKAYDVVLLDLQMPVLDGFSTRQQLKENPKVGDPCVVALSANVDQATQQKCTAAHFFGYLSKPMDIPKLADILSRVYAERQDKRRNESEAMQS